MVERMPALATQEIPTSDRSAHSAFFRQSGWLVVATIVGGAMTLGVHPLDKHIPDSEYTAFGVLLMVVSCLPTLPQRGRDGALRLSQKVLPSPS